MNKVSCSFKDVHFYCSSCKLGKSKVFPFPTHDDNSTDCNRFTWIYLLHAKSEVFDALQKFLALIANQLFKSIKILGSDSCGVNMCLSLFKNFFNLKASFLIEHVLIHHNKMGEKMEKPSSPWRPSNLTSWIFISTHLFRLKPFPQLYISFTTFFHPSYSINLHTFAFMVPSHLMLIFILLAACVLSIFDLRRERNSLHNQWNTEMCFFGLSWSISSKGYFYYDPHILRITISRNVIFFQHQYFFQTYLDSSAVENMSLPAFFLVLIPYQGLKPGLVYTRRQTPIHLANGPPSPDPPVLQRSTRSICPSVVMVISLIHHCLLLHLQYLYLTTIHKL